jgi:hypothetical protein
MQTWSTWIRVISENDSLTEADGPDFKAVRVDNPLLRFRMRHIKSK